ncbi:unnamed protein product [Linum tenue]|uniref:Uncharacterized protein n=1 Tax=Linum tenue TaxID=586396 RepID=A0AAV0R8T5_9ROSI|nr:unnamed protein product [Linum tenue]
MCGVNKNQPPSLQSPITFFKIKKNIKKRISNLLDPAAQGHDDRETDSASFPIFSTSSGDSFFSGIFLLSFSGRRSNPSASETSSELHPAFRSESENRSAFTSSASSTAWLSSSTISPSKNPEPDTWTISSTSDSLHPPSLNTDPIRPTYSSTHRGAASDLGISKNRSGEEDESEEDEDAEFLRRRSTAASLQNSTHLGVLFARPVSRLRREKLDDDDEEEDPADFSLTDLCLVRRIGSDSDSNPAANRDSRSKKSDRSSPQQKIRVSSKKKIGFPASDGLQGM